MTPQMYALLELAVWTIVTLILMGVALWLALKLWDGEDL